jgi:hypothetical protein
MSKLNVNAIEPSTGTDITLGASGDTITVPSGATFTQSGTMNASAITAGTMATARLGSGTASSTTVLYGDQTYKTEPTGGKLLQVVYNSDTATNDNTTTDYANGVGASVAITPTSASSTLYIMCTGSFGTSSGATNYNQNLNVQIYDLTNTTSVLAKTSATNIFDDGEGNSLYAQTQGSYTASVAASDTVARTYQLRFAMAAITNTRASRSSNSQMTIFEVGA